MDVTFSVGQRVIYTPIGSVPGRYVVTRLMSFEGSHAEQMYRIKGELHGDDRMVAGSALSADVGGRDTPNKQA